jgi:hypothetical protein
MVASHCCKIVYPAVRKNTSSERAGSRLRLVRRQGCIQLLWSLLIERNSKGRDSFGESRMLIAYQYMMYISSPTGTFSSESAFLALLPMGRLRMRRDSLFVPMLVRRQRSRCTRNVLVGRRGSHFNVSVLGKVRLGPNKGRDALREGQDRAGHFFSTVLMNSLYWTLVYVLSCVEVLGKVPWVL